MKQSLRSIVAFVCIFCTLQALGSSTTLAKQDLKYFVKVTNQKFDSVRVTPIEINTMSSKVIALANAAREDGTLQAAESAFLKSKASFVNDGPSVTYMYQRMIANGYKGTQQDVSEWIASSDKKSRQALVSNITKNGLYNFLVNDVANAYTELGKRLASASLRQPHLIDASFHPVKLMLVNDDCNTYIGTGLWIGFIGAGASLGGVNPLGDLLVFVGAGIALTAWYACD